MKYTLIFLATIGIGALLIFSFWANYTYGRWFYGINPLEKRVAVLELETEKQNEVIARLLRIVESDHELVKEKVTARNRTPYSFSDVPEWEKK